MIFKVTFYITNGHQQCNPETSVIFSPQQSPFPFLHLNNVFQIDGAASGQTGAPKWIFFMRQRDIRGGKGGDCPLWCPNVLKCCKSALLNAPKLKMIKCHLGCPSTNYLFPCAPTSWVHCWQWLCTSRMPQPVIYKSNCDQTAHICKRLFWSSSADGCAWFNQRTSTSALDFMRQ